jgi:acyl-CoA reductase-like NAD-dependent aldehyde dehydrogenase
MTDSTCRSPIDGSVVAHVPTAVPESSDAALAAARLERHGARLSLASATST